MSDVAEPLDLSEHDGVARVLAALPEKAGEGSAGPTVRHLTEAVRTAQQAADALGIEPERIANSLVLAGAGAGAGAGTGTDTGADGVVALLVLASGGHRVPLDRVAEAAGLRQVRMASAEEVRAWTGFVIGGVAPVGHLCPVRAFVDTRLADHPSVWAAAGHPNSVFETSYAALLAMTGGQPLDLSTPTQTAE